MDKEKSAPEISEIIKSVWDEHPDEAYRRDQSHWRGHGRWADDSLWLQIGKVTINRLNSVLRYVGLSSEEFWSQPRTVLEWGPGGGANAVALAPYANEFYGVDVSPRNLAEAERQVLALGSLCFRPVLLEADPADLIRYVKNPIDVFVSTAVFQHFPSKDYGEKVLRVLAQSSCKGAIGSIQIRYDNGNPKFAPIDRIDDYRDRHITANSYAIDEFVDICRKFRFETLYISDVRTANNYATFALRRME